MNCRHTRAELTLQPSSTEVQVQAHLATCPLCDTYRQQQTKLDTALRAELHWQAPADLTARLLVLAAAPLLMPPVMRPKTWYVRLVYVLTLLAISCSVLVGWHIAAMLVAQFGVGDTLAWLWGAPAAGIERLHELLPQSRYAIDFFLRVRDQLLWLLLTAVLWATLDRWVPRQARRQGA